MTSDIRIGLDYVKAAVAVRAQITERYATYHVLSKIVQAVALVEHREFKGTVDALYYFGGGWPSENSPGRLEAALDDFAGIYKILSLIGHGDKVEDHLKNLGITVTLQNPILNAPLTKEDINLLIKEFGLGQFDFDHSMLITTADLVRECVYEAEHLQEFICQHADIIKDELKPAAKAALSIENEEYERLFYIEKFATNPDKVSTKKAKIETSVTKYRGAARA